MFSVGADKQVKCWVLEQKKVNRSYHGHLSGVYCLDIQFSGDVILFFGYEINHYFCKIIAGAILLDSSWSVEARLCHMCSQFLGEPKLLHAMSELNVISVGLLHFLDPLNLVCQDIYL